MCILQQPKNETGIHTFLLRRKLSFAEYRQYKLILQNCVSIKREDNNDCYIKSYYFASIGYYGITAELTMKDGHAGLDLKVNPTNLLNDFYSQTEIFTRRELCKTVVSKLNDALSHIELSVDFFILSRIDLCVNVFMTPQMVETYLKLGKKSYKEYNVGKKLFEDNESNIHIILCEHCYDNYYTTCESCGRTIDYDDACYFDDDTDYPYCRHCYNQRCSSEYIHDYGFKPNPIFYGNGKRYFGVELEIDEGGHSDSNAEKICDIANEEERLIYIKHDGSLSDGMEIVTHPMTLDYHLHEMPWEDVMQKAISLGYLSHKTRTCGLHVHVNRSNFGESSEEQEECISRVLFFVERFWQELLKFSRRTESQIARWAARYGIKDNPKATLDNAKKNYSGNSAWDVLKEDPNLALLDHDVTE